MKSITSSWVGNRPPGKEKKNVNPTSISGGGGQGNRSN